MTAVNVGNVDAILRIAFSALYVGVGLTLLMAYQTPVMAVLFAAGLGGCVLLIRSALTRQCPIHDAAGINTTGQQPPRR